MPNPYAGNEEAAAYVEYYASPRMLQESVHRLYHGGIEHKKAVEARLERELYPPVPTPRRSQANIEAYLRTRVEGELLRRQYHRVALQRELTPESMVRTRNMTPAEMQKHVKHMYNDQLKQRRNRREALLQSYGISCDTATSRHRDPEEEAFLHERETKWRWPSGKPSHEDHRCLLVSPYEVQSHRPRGGGGAAAPSGKRLVTSVEREKHMRRLTTLSMPQQVTPRVVAEERAVDAPPPFRVYRKV